MLLAPESTGKSKRRAVFIPVLQNLQRGLGAAFSLPGKSDYPPQFCTQYAALRQQTQAAFPREDPGKHLHLLSS